jgi:metal-dependent HD superfamily phosphatase/phosphodiesterase
MPADESAVDAVVDDLETDEEVSALVRAQNVNATERLQYNDHGPKHVGIVRSRALALVDLLDGVVDWGVADHGLGFGADDAKVVCAAAAMLHDVGHVVHRDEHVEYSVQLAAPVIDDVLASYYDDPDERVALKGDALHAILCHHVEEEPLTPEAGIVRVADALDMERGRSRLPYTEGERSIDTVSSQAVEDVTVTAGGDEVDAPVLVEIALRNSAGVYQIDNLLKPKLQGSRIEDHVKIVAINEGEDEIVGRLEL